MHFTFTANNRIIFFLLTLNSQFTLGDGLKPFEVLDLPGVGDGGQGGVVAVRGDQADGGHQLDSLQSHLRLVGYDGSGGRVIFSKVCVLLSFNPSHLSHLAKSVRASL